MQECQYCKELNEEKNEIRVDEIYIYGNGGYYGWRCPIICCPYCGKKLKKYEVKKDDM